MRALADPGSAGGADGTPACPPSVRPASKRPSVAARWGDLGIRSLSAVVLAPAVLLCIWFGGVAWQLLIAVAAVGLTIEWLLMTGHARASDDATGLWGPLVFGAFYACVPLACLDWLRGEGAVGRDDVLFLVAVVWASDIGAYAVGRLAGGPKLAPAISPGKTWSGAVGGLLIAMLAGAAVALGLEPGSVVRALTIAALLAVVSQAGDLFESWTKRRFGVKDSGRLIPGHGGLLDRLDGLLAAAPVAAALSWAFGRGDVLWK